MGEAPATFVWPPRGESAQSDLDAMQAGFWYLEHFIGNEPDGNKSPGELGLAELTAGGGTAMLSGASYRPGGVGQAQVAIPARAAPVAPDGAGFDSKTGLADLIFDGDLIGLTCVAVRVFIDNVPDAASDYETFIGVADEEANIAEPSDGFYLFADGTPGSNWILKHARAGARVVADTGIPPVPGAWQTLSIIADDNSGIVAASIANDGDDLVQVVTVVPVNMQPAVGITPIYGIHNPGNITLAAAINLDYLGFGMRYGVPR